MHNREDFQRLFNSLGFLLIIAGIGVFGLGFAVGYVFST